MQGIKYFLGANSPTGFVSMFDRLSRPDEDRKMYVFKGGPGSGKSSFMKRMAYELYGRGHEIELITCASDPESLDAVIDHTAKVSIADGTAPHVIDAVYPGAYETILDAGNAWNADALQAHRKEIVEVSEKIALSHRLCRAYVTAAGALLDYSRETAKAYADRKETDAAISEISSQWRSTGHSGRRELRLLSAVSVGEVHFHYKTMAEMCDLIYEIEDDRGAVADSIVSGLAAAAAEKGYNTVLCPCSLKNPGKNEHLIIPELGIGVTTANRFHRGEYSASSVVRLNAEDYMHGNSEPGEETDIAGLLIKNACDAVQEAKKYHDELEAWYIAAMDFSVMDSLYMRVMKEITDNN